MSRTKISGIETERLFSCRAEHSKTLASWGSIDASRKLLQWCTPSLQIIVISCLNLHSSNKSDSKLCLRLTMFFMMVTIVDGGQMRPDQNQVGQSISPMLTSLLFAAFRL